MSRKLKSAIASVIVAVSLLSAGSVGTAITVDAKGPRMCC